MANRSTCRTFLKWLVFLSLIWGASFALVCRFFPLSSNHVPYFSFIVPLVFLIVGFVFYMEENEDGFVAKAFMLGCTVFLALAVCCTSLACIACMMQGKIAGLFVPFALAVVFQDLYKEKLKNALKDTPVIEKFSHYLDKTLNSHGAARESLYVLENYAPKGIKDGVNLVKISFDSRGRAFKECVLSGDKRLCRANSDSGMIVENRYAVLGTGAILDLATMQFVLELKDWSYDSVSVEDGQAVFRNLNEETVFDFATHKVSVVTLEDKLPGLISPDGLSSIKEGGSSFYLYHLNGEKEKMLANLNAGLSDLSSFSGGLACLWLDSKRILTQSNPGKVVILDTDGKVEPLLEIKGPEKVIVPCSLYQDKQGQIIYSYCGGNWTIDVEKAVAKPLRQYALGHDFAMTVNSPTPNLFQRLFSSSAQKLLFKGKRIGLKEFDPSEVRTSDGVIGMKYRDERIAPGWFISSGGGIAVWCARRKRWKTYKFWVEGVLGWVTC